MPTCCGMCIEQQVGRGAKHSSLGKDIRACTCLFSRSGQLNAVLTELSTEQADYIGVAKSGPYKPATYRY